jgi:hypothetical protein
VLMHKPSYLVISDWTTSTRSKWRLHVFMETGHHRTGNPRTEATASIG